jgi:hypothetical protein
MERPFGALEKEARVAQRWLRLTKRALEMRDWKAHPTLREDLERRAQEAYATKVAELQSRAQADLARAREMLEAKRADRASLNGIRMAQLFGSVSPAVIDAFREQLKTMPLAEIVQAYKNGPSWQEAVIETYVVPHLNDRDTPLQPGSGQEVVALRKMLRDRETTVDLRDPRTTMVSSKRIPSEAEIEDEARSIASAEHDIERLDVEAFEAQLVQRFDIRGGPGQPAPGERFSQDEIDSCNLSLIRSGDVAQ